MNCHLKRISLLQCIVAHAIFNKQCSVYSIYCAVFHFKHGRRVYIVRCLSIRTDCLVKQELNLFIQAWNWKVWRGKYPPSSLSLALISHLSVGIYHTFLFSFPLRHTRSYPAVRVFGVRLWIWMACFLLWYKKKWLTKMKYTVVTREMHHYAVHVYLYIYSPYMSAHLTRSILLFNAIL